MSKHKVIVHLGPSMRVSDAKQILDADFRPPIKRGDLSGINSGSIVAIIDGVFEQDLSVSPKEILEAINRGVIIFGGSSMGALRAAEIPSIIGVGRVYQWYRDDIISRDDEVALLFDPYSKRALTVPTVNVRYAVERLYSMGTISQDVGDAIVQATQAIPFKNRTYTKILDLAGLINNSDSKNLIDMLNTYDIKNQDAQAVLEKVDSFILNDNKRERAKSIKTYQKSKNTVEMQNGNNGANILIWESGDVVNHDELYDFLVSTGKLTKIARKILLRYLLQDEAIKINKFEYTSDDAQRVFESIVRRWGWMSSEETKVSLIDLGLDQKWVGEYCSKEALIEVIIAELLQKGNSAFRNALLTELFMNELALKREVMRLGSLRFFASQASEIILDSKALRIAENVLCKLNRVFHLKELRQQWTLLGIDNIKAQNNLIEQVARARHSSSVLIDSILEPQTDLKFSNSEGMMNFSLSPCPKPENEARFYLPIETAENYARQIGSIIGVTRIGLIGELADLGGIQIAQASRPGNAWSSSYGSGKSISEKGAIIGSIMEETEKWAQEQFKPAEEDLLFGNYQSFKGQVNFIDPESLDLPYDSIYNEKLELYWYPCLDILNKQVCYMPVDLLLMNRQKNDIAYTSRGARKHLATNGLGSGFSREEALLHALCEYVERHAQRMAELLISNPGNLGEIPYQFLDLTTASDLVNQIVTSLKQGGGIIRVLDITSEIKIPTFKASISRNLQRADGFGTHPNPNIAIEMALLEAAQTIASSTAGAREDLSIRARSLGRHERPRPVNVDNAWFWMDPDPLNKKVQDIQGLASSDILEDINWSLQMIRKAGIERVVVLNLTLKEIIPAHVVRVFIPGLETNNPFYTGPRARLLLLNDLLPKWHMATV